MVKAIHVLMACAALCMLATLLYFFTLDNGFTNSKTIDPSSVLGHYMSYNKTMAHHELHKYDHNHTTPHILRLNQGPILHKGARAQFCLKHDKIHNHKHNDISGDSHQLDDVRNGANADGDSKLMHIKEEAPFVINAEYISANGKQGNVFQMCMSKHPGHFHSILFELNNTAGDCDLYAAVGSKNEEPNPDNWDWKVLSFINFQLIGAYYCKLQ